jgi:flagellin-like hook-associated protein FlgL
VRGGIADTQGTLTPTLSQRERGNLNPIPEPSTMSRIAPIPTSRVGDLFIRQRLVGQLQSDQLDLFRLQTQISSGRRLQLPSDDAPAAMRVINLQRLLDRKAQIRTNVSASSHYLTSAESQLKAVTDGIIQLRGAVVDVAGSVTPDSARTEVANQVDRLLSDLVGITNSKVLGRYLFAGSRSQVQPYDFKDQFVEYLGNEGTLRSYVDIERLFDTNLSGTEVFGGVSTPVQGSVDLNPHLTEVTLLSTVNGGSGISRNGAVSVSINTGPSTVTSVVDLSGAVTVGDVIRLIENGAPTGTNVVVDVAGSGLRLSTTSGTISVSEVAQGRTAHELGIFTAPSSPPGSVINGEDLDPAVLKTTQLNNLLGTKAYGRIESTSANNDIWLTASQNGIDLNGVTVEFIPGGLAGSEAVAYDVPTKTLTVQVQGGFSTATQVAAAITAEGTFTARADYHDATSSALVGAGAVEVANFGVVTSGGSGEELDLASGLIVTNGDDSVTLDTSSVETVEELLNLFNGSDLGLLAEINEAGNGIDVRSRLSGANLTIGENGGTTATQLGIRTYTGDTLLADFNRGIGVPTTADLEVLDTAQLDDLRIVARDGTVLLVDLSTATSLQDVADLINAAPGNFAGTTAVTASLNENGNGIQLADAGTVTTGRLTVEAIPGSVAAEYLGFLSGGQTQHSSTLTNAAGDNVLSGSNVLGNDLLIVARDGAELWIDLAGAETVQDVIDRINNNPVNNTGTTAVTARLAITGNGIELMDASTGAGTLTLRSLDGSQAAEFLGFVDSGATESDPADIDIDGAGNQVLTSEDRHTLEADSLFNTLLRLRTALLEGNVEEIGRSLDHLDVDFSRVNFARAELGARLQNLDVIDVRLQDEDVQLRTALSRDFDVDLVEAISNLTAKQFAFEASLRTTASLLQLSLLNFI